MSEDESHQICDPMDVHMMAQKTHSNAHVSEYYIK